MKPSISYMMPTYGRFPREANLVNEAVYWYTRQPKGTELIILNDAPEQTLFCRVEGVRVYNSNKRYPSLGDKYNAMVALAKADILAPFEDDDISLPNRTEVTLEALGAKYEYWNPQKTWYETGGNDPVKDTHGVNHNTSAYRRGVCAYRSCNDQDMWMDMDLKKAAKVAPPGDKRVYVYRFGVSGYHLSAMGGIWNKVPPPASGTWEIVPKMYRDYSIYCGE